MSDFTNRMDFSNPAKFSAKPDEKLSTTVTCCPRDTSSRTRWDPINPAPPVTAQCLISFFTADPAGLLCLRYIVYLPTRHSEKD